MSGSEIGARKVVRAHFPISRPGALSAVQHATARPKGRPLGPLAALPSSASALSSFRGSLQAAGRPRAGLALGRCLCSPLRGPRPPQGCSAAVDGCVAVQRGWRAGCWGPPLGGSWWLAAAAAACKCSPRRAPQASGSLTTHIRVVCWAFQALRGAQAQFGRPVQAPVPGRSWPFLAPVPAGTALGSLPFFPTGRHTQLLQLT